jgi:hypothetical protein
MCRPKEYPFDEMRQNGFSAVAMKKVLSLLLAFVFIQTQAWALSGGPVFSTGSGAISLVGTYAGVLIPDSVQPGNSLSGRPLPVSVSSVGLFSLGIPATGLSTGATIFFVNGDAFVGTITGVADPGKASFRGIIQTRSNFALVDPAFPDVDFRIFASGSLKADIFTSTDTVAGAGVGSTRLEGTAVVNVFGGGPGYDGTFTYSLDGFKQSETASSTTTIPGLDDTNN